jgi:predicted AAA+ superfamily ATPase
MAFTRDFVKNLQARLTKESKPLIQVVLGPRQVGKTTGVKSVLKEVPTSHYANADLASAPNQQWIIEQWQTAKALGKGTVLVLDEIQKISRWSDVLKGLFDEDRETGFVKPVLLGSASLTLREGLGDSLLGRFELIEVPHWSFRECKEAFGWDFNTYLMFGGYPGPVNLINDSERWQSFMRDSVLESVLSKDIFMLAKISKPALFRQVLELALLYPAQEISYQKIVGQLQETGSVETIKSYLTILNAAYLVSTLEKFSSRPLSVKSSSPKILPLCPALIHSIKNPGEILTNPTWRGRVIEAAVGAHLGELPGVKNFYWRDGNDEVDFVLKYGNKILGIEVKSGTQYKGDGLTSFKARFKNSESITLNETLVTQLLQMNTTSECREWLFGLGV